MTRRRVSRLLLAGGIGLAMVIFFQAVVSARPAGGAHRNVTSPAEELALVRGSVRFDGTLFTGGGITVTHQGPGAYFVAYDAGTFASTDQPTVLVQPLGSGGVADVTSETAVGFTVSTGVGDHSFKFIAVGPR
jgi:hypothetical protein